MNREMASASSIGLLGLCSIASAIIALRGGLATANALSVVWGVILFGAIARRAISDRELRRARNGSALKLSALFSISAALWLAADGMVLTGFGAGDSGSISAADLVDALATSCFCIVILWVGGLRGWLPDLRRQLDGVVFAAALVAPLWVWWVVPGGSTPDVLLWFAGVTVLLGFGATYILGAGLWNAPAVLLALGVVANVGMELGLRALQQRGELPAGAPVYAGHGAGFALWTLAIVHPGLRHVFSGGWRTRGMSHALRVWLLAPLIALPMAVVGWDFVRDEPAPGTLLLGVLGAMTLLVGLRAVLEQRAGNQTWHVFLMISMSMLVAAFAAVSLTLVAQSAGRASVRAQRLAAAVPEVERLQPMLAAAELTGRGPSGRQALESQLVGLRETFAESSQEVRAPFELFVVQVNRALDARSSAMQVRDLTAPSYARLIAQVRSSTLDAVRSADAAMQRARFLALAGLLSALIVITLLLVRYSSAGRRQAVGYLERHDALTGLSNRHAVEHRLRKTAEDTGPGREHPSLVLLSLDDFKSVNDVHGHAVGSAVLRSVGERMGEVLSGRRLIARLGGDTFALLVDDAPADGVERIAGRLLEILSEPYDIDGQPQRVHVSIGIALGGPAEGDADGSLAVLRNAELAMYDAKTVTGDSLKWFEPAMYAAARDRLALVGDLERAIELEELHLVYQPIVDLDTGETVGLEALARWNHPVRGPLSPADFIPLAETSGLIVPLGGWALREACRQMQSWHEPGTEGRYISVNVASQQLAAGALPSQVREALAASGLDPERLLLEMTESSMLEQVDATLEQMDAVKALGVRFALDDFGTGYSSLSYLRRFQVHVVKVDKSFVDDVVGDAAGRTLVEAIIQMATGLEMKVIAEGIEHQEQAEILRAAGGGLGQGYWFARPLLPADVETLPRHLGAPATSVRAA